MQLHRLPLASSWFLRSPMSRGVPADFRRPHARGLVQPVRDRDTMAPRPSALHQAWMDILQLEEDKARDRGTNHHKAYKIARQAISQSKQTFTECVLVMSYRVRCLTR